MLTYNTQLERLVLPEYGRTVQKIVEHCMTLPEKEERNACATEIVRCITNILPEMKNAEENAKLWDHLAIISGFKLDIDYPGEGIKAENLATRPEPVAYGRTNPRRRQYGKLIETMIDYCSNLEPSDEQLNMATEIANQMKKSIVNATGEDVDDARIFEDLANMSGGRLLFNEETVRLHDYLPAPQAPGKKKKKK